MANTLKSSLNHVPAGIKKIQWREGEVNLDLGAGRYPERVTQYLWKFGTHNVPYDPNNPAIAVEDVLLPDNYDTVTCMNVLNVIQDDKELLETVRLALISLAPGGRAWFQVYECNCSGVGAPTTKGYQRNMKAGDYAPLFFDFFRAKRRGNLWCCEKHASQTAMDYPWYAEEVW